MIMEGQWRNTKFLGYSHGMLCSKLMRTLPSSLTIAVFIAMLSLATFAADPPAAADSVTFVNGERMSGQLVKVADGKVFFKSDMLGDVSFDLAKVKELKTAKPFAVIAKTAKLDKKHANPKVPEGTLEVADGKIAVAGTTAAPIAPADVSFIVDQPGFDKTMAHHEGWMNGWVGAITAGVSLVEATQKNQNITTGIALVRSVPGVDWLPPSSRTTLDFSNSYGKVTQPGTPDVKTSIYHADAEQDEYLSQKLYGFGHLSFDHNFSQGLDLQSLFGGGLGYTILKDKVQELDAKADLHYEKQQFETSSLNLNLFGSEFGETYLRKLPKNMIFNEGIVYDASWNDTHAYSWQGTLGLAAPISKKFSLSINLLDANLNNPPPGFKKNSLQFTTGLTYTIK